MKFWLSIAVLLAAAAASAQEPEHAPELEREGSFGAAAPNFEVASPRGTAGVRAALAPQIVVRETADTQAVTSMIDAAPRGQRMTVYAVRLFSDNSQNAGANARAVAARFAEIFGSDDVRVDYQTPYFRVTAGRFIDRTDAVALCGRALGNFPKSFVVEEHVSVE